MQHTSTYNSHLWYNLAPLYVGGTIFILKDVSFCIHFDHTLYYYIKSASVHKKSSSVKFFHVALACLEHYILHNVCV